MMILIIIVILIRIATDFIYPADKPLFVQILFTSIMFLLFFLNIKHLKFYQIRLIIFLIIATAYSYFASIDVIFEQFLQNLKIILAPIVLLAISQNPKINFEKLREISFKYLPFIMLFFLFLFIKDYEFSYLLNDFTNNPFHTVSQVIAKISLLYINSSLFFLFILILFVLNVRSNIIPVIFIKLKKYFKLNYGIIILFAVLGLSLYLLDLNYIFERFFYKGRIEQDNNLNDITSGRIEIILEYILYIGNNFTALNYFFGTGNLYLQGELMLSAHNDLLNGFTEYGLVGLLAIFFMFKEVFKNIDTEYYQSVLIYFLFVFFTNGILFHQSNIIFALYLKNKNKASNEI